MSGSHPADTPVASSLAPLEPARVPSQNVSAVARGPYDPAGQPQFTSGGFVLGIDGWNRLPWAAGRALVEEAARLGFTLVVASPTCGAEALDPFVASNSIATEVSSSLLAASVSLRAHLHPVHVARFVANLDHVSSGRAALVFEAGDDAVQARRFGLDPATEAEAETDEFITLVKHAWAWSTPFDFEGRFFASRRSWLCGPRPSRAPRPFLGLRGGAEASELAARSFDWLVLNGEADCDVARAARDRAAIAYGRRLLVFASLAVSATPSPTLPERLATLATVHNFDGVVLSFEDGLRGLHEFGAQVLPLLQANSLRWSTQPAGAV